MEDWIRCNIGDVCKTISDTYRGDADNVVLVNTSDVLEGKCLNHQKSPNKDLKGQFKKTFQKDDILYSEIRPANKRFAYIDFDGTDYIASTKLMVIRHNDNIIPQFLYYIITSQAVIDELQMLAESRSGTFPQITFSELASLPIGLPPLPEQTKIVRLLKALDDKIEVNRRINDNFVIESLFEILQIWMLTTPINDNLEQQGQALFEEYVMNPNKPRTQLLNDYALINPTRTISKGRVARCIDMSSLPTKGTFPSDWTFKEFNGGMKFQNGDTIMARITPCLENGKTAYINFLDENEVAFGSTEYIVLSAQEGICSELLYFLARYDDFVSYAVAHMNGSSGRQRVSGNDIANYVMPEITNETMGIVSEKLHKIMEVIKNNSLESRYLAEIRDALLPRLMSGELKLEETKM